MEKGTITFHSIGLDGQPMDFTFNATSVEAGLRKWAEMHGFIQKISDRAAIGRDPETGASATPEEKFAAMKECAERLMSGGPWNAVATGGGGNQGGLLYRAMKAIYPNAWSDKTSFAAYIVQKAISESERLKKKVSESDVRAGLMAVKRVAKEIERIRQEEGKAVGIDAGGMLQELETMK
jgi:hypothetical protein